MSDDPGNLLKQISDSSNEFTIDEARKVIDNIWLNHSIDTEDILHNRFFYEICPILAIAQYVGSHDTKIIFRGESERFDGLIIDPSIGGKQKLEMTAAIDGHQESLRMELLRERGHAPAYQKISAKETKKNRKFKENLSEAQPREYSNAQTLKLLCSALKKKLEKSKQNYHYCGAWLGIVFDDYLSSDTISKEKRYNPICVNLIKTVVSHDCVFSRVFCVGMSRQYIFDSGCLS